MYRADWTPSTEQGHFFGVKKCRYWKTMEYELEHTIILSSLELLFS